MQEINLLQNRIKDRTEAWDKKSRNFRAIFILIIVLEIAGFGGLYYMTDLNVKQTEEVNKEIAVIQSSIDEKKEQLNSAQAFQAQLKNIKTLLDSHLYWSVFFDQLTAATYQQTEFVTLTVNSNGKMHLEGGSSSYQGVAKVLLGLSTSPKFGNIKLLSINPSEGDTASGYLFSIDLSIAPDIFIKR